LLGAVSCGHPSQYRESLSGCEAFEDGRDEIAAVCLIPADEASEYDGREAIQAPGLRKVLQHAIHAVTALAGVLQKENALVRTLQRRPEYGLQHGEIAAEDMTRDALSTPRRGIEGTQGGEHDLASIGEENLAQLR
jgi:hypothetical protein